ncbi:hypothetical protein DUI87_26553 [Hirundo rustica rustica]|uniref:Uncharacterized protein n=1 Tax=Hirundo rustica rustica TaxID=333673 RepID=A0A3M0JDH0_HIRRU|nr:hypothetical protein DUI87_26553 [Hirundo rustica rustica]
MIHTNSQFIIWEAKWRRALNELRDKYQGGANAGITVALLPREVLTDIKNAARKAMVQIPLTGVTESSYTDIKQGPSESFTSFVDRLMQAVDRQVSDDGVKPHLIRCLAFANANPECVISAMPGQPLMAEVIEACSKLGTPQHVTTVLGDQVKKAIKDAFMNFKQGQCYKCSKQGHFKKDFPKLANIASSLDACPSQAKEIISACPDCQLVQPPASMGAVNPRGLHSLQLWQTDVTKYPSFGKLKNIHVSVDTFSGAVFVSLHTGETVQHACRHFLQAFASLGILQEIKTDKGPTYIGKVLDKFLKRWGVHHTFGIPHSPTGQAIIERTHQTLKTLLDRQKRGEADATPYMRLNKALYVLNFLNGSFAEPTPPIVRHFSNSTRAKLKENPLVFVRNPETGQIEGPFKLITWGKGYACVSTAVGPKWLAARNVKPYRVHTQAEADPKTGEREVATQT